MCAACAAGTAPAVRVAAPAKVNLYLGVHRELDERGYHLVDSVMASLGLADEVEVTPARELSVACDPDAGCPARKNTCWKAVEAMDAEFGVGMGFAVRVTRHVPNQAGLGGSSSDAAATIVGVCELCGIDSRDPRVAAVARRVGADVPFFLAGGVCYLDGGGDVLRESFDVPCDCGRPTSVVVVRAPGDGVSTPAAYGDFDRDPVDAGALEPMLAALRVGDADAVVENVGNNLAPVACRLLSTCAATLEWLRGQGGVRVAQVSGSGSSCFAICEDDAVASEIEGAARERGWWACATRLSAEGAVLLGR